MEPESPNVYFSLFSLGQNVYHKLDPDSEMGMIYKVEFNVSGTLMYGVVWGKDKQNIHFEKELSDIPIYNTSNQY